MERSSVEVAAAELTQRLGVLVRRHRQEMSLSLEDLAAVSGVGIRFIHELEHGKPTCQIGRALVVARLVGLDPISLLEDDLRQIP